MQLPCVAPWPTSASALPLNPTLRMTWEPAAIVVRAGQAGPAGRVDRGNGGVHGGGRGAVGRGGRGRGRRGSRGRRPGAGSAGGRARRGPQGRLGYVRGVTARDREDDPESQAQRHWDGERDRNTRRTTLTSAAAQCGPMPAEHSIHLRGCPLCRSRCITVDREDGEV